VIRRKQEIVIEFEETVVIPKPQRSSLLWCVECREQVPMIAAEQAARSLGISARTVYRWVEAGRLHFTEAPEGVLICVNSITERTLDRP